MKKHNPLFVDSTKFQGDCVNTQFELMGLCLYSEEEAFVRLVDGIHLEIDVALKADDICEEKVFKGYSLLNHHQNLSIQFYIKTYDQFLIAMPPQKIVVSYFLNEKWNPQQGVQLMQLNHMEPDSKSKRFRELSSRLTEQLNIVGSLLDKFR